MTLLIRQYQPADLNELLLAWESANQLAHPFLSEEFVDKVRHDIPKLYIPNSDTWVVEKNKTLIGFIALIDNEVGAIFVDTKFHGVGAGRALMDKARSLHSTLELEVFKENTVGRKFYDSYGFERLNETTHAPTGRQVLRLVLYSKADTE